MEKKWNPNSQPAQGQLLSLGRRPGVRDEAGRRGQWTERARIFALPREPSLSRATSSSPTLIKLPPVHLGQPKVGPRKLQHLKVPQVELGQPRAAPQGSRSQALSLCGDTLPPLPPLPQLPPLLPLPQLAPLPPLPQLAPLPPRPCLVSPRDTRSWDTELGSAGEKGPQPRSPCPWQPYTPVPRVFLSPLRVAQEGTARMSLRSQLLPVPPIPSRAPAMECSIRGTVLEEQDPQRENDSELSQGENSSEQELSPVTEDSKLFPGDSNTDPELSPVEDTIEVATGGSTSDQELSEMEEAIEAIPGDSTSDQELSPVEKAIKIIPGDSTSDEQLSQWEEAIEAIPGDSPSDPALSPVDEAIPDMERELSRWAAAAPAGTAEEEEPPKPLAPEEEKAPTPSVMSEERPSTGTQSPPSVPLASSQASAYQEQNITGDMLSQALLEMLELRQQREEEYALQQWMAAEATGPAQGEESLVPAPHSSPSPSPAQLGAQALREQQEGTAAGSVLAVQERMEDSDEEMKYWQFLDDLEPFLVRDPELSEGEGEEEAELSLGEINNSQEMSQGKECPEQELSQEVSDWEEYLEQGLSQGDVNSCEELSDWEEHIGQDLSQGETCVGQDVSRGNGSRPSAQSSWEDDSDKELVQEIWEEETEHGIGTKPLHPEDDEGDELGVLELPPEEQNRGGFAALGLPVPVPREAWVEGPAPELRSPGPLCASPAALQGQGPVGHAASPALEEPLPEAGTESPVPAPRKRPSRFRRALRALRGLFRCPCLAPQPED